MTSKTALPIARLRALGCRVSTVIGHDPAIGDWIYGITLPKGVAPGTVTDDMATTRGAAEVRKAPADDRLIARTALYQIGKPRPTQAELEQAERDIAALLSAIADILNGRTLR